MYPDNCSTRANAMLDAAGIPQAQGPVNPAYPAAMPGPDPAIPGAAGQRAQQLGDNTSKLDPPGQVQTIQIPKGSLFQTHSNSSTRGQTRIRNCLNRKTKRR